MTEYLDLSQSLAWRAWLAKLPSTCRDVYFTPEYYSLYENYGDGEAKCFVFEKEGEIALYPFLINPISPLGFKLDKEYYDIQGAYGYNGLISSTDNKAFIADFWNDFDAFCQEHDFVAEFMRFHPLLNNHLLASPEMKTFLSRNTVGLDLTDDDIWMHQISSKNRNMIRKAEKECVEIIDD